MRQFEFATATRILFGRGKLAELPGMLRPFGTRALLVTGHNTERASVVTELLDSADFVSAVFPIPSEPTLDLVRAGAKVARTCSMVIGFGGGSAIDGAKAIAALATNSGEPVDYLEVIGEGRELEVASLPFVAVPTTAGTGAEVTRNAVLDSPQHGLKASLRSPSMLARVALIDPQLTVDLPPEITARTGLDAVTQLIEAYVSCRANAMTDLFCLGGLTSARDSLRSAFQDGQNIEARERMSWASLLSGLALANAGLGAVHGFAGPLGGMLHAPHGALCAALLPHVMSANIEALRQRAPLSDALLRYGTVAKLLTHNEAARPQDGTKWIAQLCRDLNIEPLAAYGLRTDQIDDLLAKATGASSMKGNPLQLKQEELRAIAEAAL